MSDESIEEVPVGFALKQNYPSPFNPTTTLSFVIGHFSFVSLRVYDVLGREVAILVNEIKKPGTYSIDFDGSDFASGVHFYKLASENSVEVKKMVLIR